MAEQQNLFLEDSLFEHRFWLSVLRDHSTFIYLSLGAEHATEIAEAHAFYHEAVRQLGRLESFAQGSKEAMRAFTMEAADLTQRLIAYSQALLDRQLACAITLHLPPSIVDHTIREEEEYLGVMAHLLSGTRLTGAALAIHEANLWLPDGSGHAALIRSNVDAQEEDVFDTAHQWKMQFDKLNLSLQEMQTKLRSGVRWVPSLERLMALTTQQFTQFIQYLEHLKELVEECAVLGDLKPLLMDHMAREATYFLEKLERARRG